MTSKCWEWCLET